jgi:hypothetical protein
MAGQFRQFDNECCNSEFGLRGSVGGIENEAKSGDDGLARPASDLIGAGQISLFGSNLRSVFAVSE